MRRWQEESGMTGKPPSPPADEKTLFVGRDHPPVPDEAPTTLDYDKTEWVGGSPEDGETQPGSSVPRPTPSPRLAWPARDRHEWPARGRPERDPPEISA